MIRRIELLSGLAAALLGILGVAYALFGPTGSYVEVTSDGSRVVSSGSTSLWETQDFSLITIVFFVVMLADMLLAAAGAWLHAQHGDAAGVALLWVTTVVLLGGTLVSLLSVGLFFAPAALLALIATISGSIIALSHDGRDQPPVAT